MNKIGNCNQETPFVYLKKRNGEKYDKTIISDWLTARQFVLDLLKMKELSISPEDNCHLEVTIRYGKDKNNWALLSSIVRHISLYAHYPNFAERDVYGNLLCSNRTVITLLCSDCKEVLTMLSNEEYLGNLLEYCKYTIDGIAYNINSYLDLDFYFHTTMGIDETSIELKLNDFRICQELPQQTTVKTIDTRKAVLTSRIYNLGADINNIPAEDIHSTDRYVAALNTFQYVEMTKGLTPLIDHKKWNESQARTKEGLSNIFCSDCFELRKNSIEKCWKEKCNKKQEDKNNSVRNVWMIWCKQNIKLSESEHARWIVEKLIMGYRPLRKDERIQSDRLFDNMRENYLKKLKSQDVYPGHIDLCSYHDLRRIRPNDLKYDSFLMLAIPRIIESLY